MRDIHLNADYSWWPVWEYEPNQYGIPYPNDFDPHDLPISNGLADDLNDWADVYSDTLDQSYPPDSGFPTKEEALAFARRGLELGKRLQEELGPGFKVIIDFTVEDFADYVQK